MNRRVANMTRVISRHMGKALRIMVAALAFLAANRLSWLYGLCQGDTTADKLAVLLAHMDIAFATAVPSLYFEDIKAGCVAAFVAAVLMYLHSLDKKKLRHGREFGSARWGTAADIRPYVNPAFRDNVILTNTEFLTMESRPKNPKYARNKNCLILGGSGSGKTRYYLKPSAPVRAA